MLLATASEVFQVMINGSWKEKNEVEIVDASADAFKEFLQFVYLSKAKVTIENVAEVMNLGNKYDVMECFNICGEFLKANLVVDNICEAYELVIRLEHKELEKKYERYIKHVTTAVFEQERTKTRPENGEKDFADRFVELLES